MTDVIMMIGIWILTLIPFCLIGGLIGRSKAEGDYGSFFGAYLGAIAGFVINAILTIVILAIMVVVRGDWR